MRLRSAAVVAATVVAAVVVGAAVGYAAARPGPADAPRPVEIAGASPIPAQPSVPIDPFRPYAKDIDYPALSAGLTYRRHRITGSGHTWSYRVPAGWKLYPGTGVDPSVRWRPADEPTQGGYGLRVLPIGGSRITPEQQITVQDDSMAHTYPDERVVHATGDTVWYEYRSVPDNLHRFDDFAWVRLPDSPYAGFELSVFGRKVDRAGLDDLIGTVRDSVTLVR